jgi:tripartite-type tricarboxylate transporter receptor subunit TctC
MKFTHFVFAALFLLSHAAFAQDYPNKPVRVVVPWPPGGTTDVAGRAIAQRLSVRMSSPFVVENRGGATGMIGATAVAQSPADGYTLLIASAETQAINPYTYRKLSYDPVKDLVVISPFAINPFTVVVRGDFPASSINALVDLAKASPGKYTYSSAGLGSASQLAMEMFKMQAGVDLLHIPFQGEAPAVTALMAGQVDAQILPAGRAAALSKSGKIKVVAVTTQDRFFGMTDVPTLRESGFDKVNIANWFAIAAPAQTPAPIVQRLYSEIQAIVTTPDAQAAFRGMGLDVYPPISQQDFQTFVNSEMTRWGEVIQRANVRLEQKQ